MSDYPITGPNTTFEEIYDRFFGKITDDMYVEWTKEAEAILCKQSNQTEIAE